MTLIKQMNTDYLLICAHLSDLSHLRAILLIYN